MYPVYQAAITEKKIVNQEQQQKGILENTANISKYPLSPFSSDTILKQAY